MATTAHLRPNVDTTVPDIMDLQSESGLDFDDGDIELDLEPAPSAQRQDDDVSIKDAGTDAGLDTQTVVADQDDFMIDHEDFIEEDQVQYDDQANALPTSPSNIPATQEQAPTPIDEDLIDYSDDEEDNQSPSDQHRSLDQDADEVHGVQDEHTDLEAEHTLAEAPASDSVTGNILETHVDQIQNKDEVVQEINVQEQVDVDEFEVDNEVEDQTDGDDGGVLLQDPEAQTNDSEHLEDISGEQRSIETRSITVNYEGNELWLFKQHDAEDSGDWLLEDIQLLHSSLSNLFQACRASLGENISNETELGLRFDHFHNMELFEDNSACVAVSLERLVDLYHTLHAQDGDDEPESFYMCLLSRPRFATLLSDVAKHAEQGSGYSGLNSAVAAGETHFADVYSGHSTEHDAADWDEERGAEEEHYEDTDSTSEAELDAELGAEYAEHEEQGENESGGDDAIEEIARTEHDNGSTSEGVTYLDQVSHEGAGPIAQDAPEHSEEFVEHDDVTDQTTRQGSQSLSTTHEEQLENDTVDYSDADEQDDEDEPQTGTLNAPSPSPTTVQGDYPTLDEDPLRTAESAEHEEETHSEPDGVALINTQNQDDAQTEEQFSQVDHTESYQEFAQTYDEDDPFKEFHVDSTETYPTEPDLGGFTNQDNTGYDDQDLDQQLQNDFLSGADFDGIGAGESTDTANDFVEGDDLLDLDNAPEWATDQEPTQKVPAAAILVHDDVTGQHEEEEDGEVKQPAVAASSAADPVATSSTLLQETSPQGQKRSIDEVGDSVGDALDSTGMLWVPVFHAHFTDADIVVPDIKRPRV